MDLVVFTRSTLELEIKRKTSAFSILHENLFINGLFQKKVKTGRLKAWNFPGVLHKEYLENSLVN